MENKPKLFTLPIKIIRLLPLVISILFILTGCPGHDDFTGPRRTIEKLSYTNRHDNN